MRILSQASYIWYNNTSLSMSINDIKNRYKFANISSIIDTNSMHFVYFVMALITLICFIKCFKRFKNLHVT